MWLYRVPFWHTPKSPFEDGQLCCEADGGIAVNESGVILGSGPFAELRARFTHFTVRALEGYLLPGLIDTHVHFPQLRIIGALGLPLLDWLSECALPEEARMREEVYARQVASEFVEGLLRAGTTTALVFGSHFASAVDLLFEEASRRGLSTVAGLVVSDRLLRPELHTSPQRAYDEGLALARRWHGRGRNLYAVTPRFALSCSPELLDACGELLRSLPGLRFTSHINENRDEIASVRALFPSAPDYLSAYEAAGLIGPGGVLAHNLHPQERELLSMSAQGCAAAHCPCSNAALGSGLFPLRRHLQAGVHVSLGSDVGAGAGLSLFKEGLQAYYAQQLLPGGVPLRATHLLYLTTLAGATALGLQGTLGDFSAGKQFDALLLSPEAGSTLNTALKHAPSAERALSAIFSLATPSDTARVWVGGKVAYSRAEY